MTNPLPAQALIRRGLPLVWNSTQNPHLPVAAWIFSCSGLVATIVHVGGVTRLTKSGLSMTDWKPFGGRPPMTQEEWETEFDRYKQFPEFEQRRNMTLSEFKTIYYWEWGHRMLGRSAGLLFGIPWAYFLWKGNGLIPRGYHGRLAGLFALGGTQGLIGWWMVKSGLGEDRRGDKHEIRVSPYRLATHLTVATTTFMILLHTGLQLTAEGSAQKEAVEKLAKSLSADAKNVARRCRAGAMAVTGLTGLTLVSGAFVAGNDAGRAYNVFPHMTPDSWLPPSEELWDPKLSGLRNFFENTATVQLDHRILGTTTAVAGLSLATAGWAFGRRAGALTPQALRGVTMVGGVATAQATLGIATLLQHVPIPLAAAHQVGSLALLSSGVYLVHSLRYARPALLARVNNGAVLGKIRVAS